MHLADESKQRAGPISKPRAIKRIVFAHTSFISVFAGPERKNTVIITFPSFVMTPRSRYYSWYVWMRPTYWTSFKMETRSPSFISIPAFCCTTGWWSNVKNVQPWAIESTRFRLICSLPNWPQSQVTVVSVQEVMGAVDISPYASQTHTELTVSKDASTTSPFPQTNSQ